MSFGHLSDFEKGKIAQAQKDTTRFDEMIVDMKRQLTAANERVEKAGREILDLILAETNTTIEDAEVRGGTPFEILGRMITERNQLRTVIAARGTEMRRLRDTLIGAAREVERVAFDMRPRNNYTPQFVGIAVSMRNHVRPPSAVKKDDHERS